MGHRNRPFGATMLYHRDYPEGIVFTDEELFNDALESGEWGTAPYAIPASQDALLDEPGELVKVEEIVAPVISEPPVQRNKPGRKPGRK